VSVLRFATLDSLCAGAQTRR